MTSHVTIVGILLISVLTVGVALGLASPVASSDTNVATTNGSITVNGSLNVGFGDGDGSSGPPKLSDSLDGPPTDPNYDGLFEDLNGNGVFDYDDIVVLFHHLLDPEVTDHTEAFDFNRNGRIDFDDVVTLFEAL